MSTFREGTLDPPQLDMVSNRRGVKSRFFEKGAVPFRRRMFWFLIYISHLPPFREDTNTSTPQKNDFTNTLYLFYKHKNLSKQTTSRNDSILTCYLVIENRINTLCCCFPYFLLVYISIGTPSHPHIPWHTYNSFSRLNWASHFCCTTTAIVKGTQRT